MARQRIGTLEQHFEKGLLALAALGLLGVVAWQIVGSKNTVKVDKTDGLPLNQGYSKLAEMAGRLTGELGAENPPLPEVSKVGLLDEFNRRLTGSVAPVGQLAWNPAPFKLQGMEVAGAMGAERKIAIPGLPTPSKPIALSFMSTIDPEVAAAVRAARADLVPAWPNEAPFDVAAVSVETTIDGTALKAALEKDPDGTGPLAALPKSWWDATQVLAVDLVRERQLENGQWGESTVIGTLPEGLDLLAELNAEAVNAERLNQITVEAQQREDEVQRPEFLKRADMGGQPVGQAWAPPSDAIAGTGVNSEIFALQRSLRALDKRIADLDRAMKGSEKVTTTAAPTPGRGPAREAPRGPAGGAANSTASSAGATNMAELKTRIDRATKEREVLAKQLEALGQKDAPAAKAVAAQRDFSTLLTGNAIRVWGHDISVKRGQTYRYQARVHLSNPLFGRSAFMAEADAAAGKNPTMTLPDSGWSDAVTVDPENYLFITSASIPQVGNALNRTASASAELYTFSWGYWRTVKVALEPGDPIAGRVLVPDVAKIAAMAAAPEPAAEPAAAGKPPVKAEPSLPRKDITVSRDAYLLDVTGIATTGAGIGGSAKTDYQAYLREGQGRISVRRPEAEREDKQYKRIAESARQGDEQIKRGLATTAAGANSPAGVRPPGEERQPVQPVRPPGGGGG